MLAPLPDIDGLDPEGPDVDEFVDVIVTLPEYRSIDRTEVKSLVMSPGLHQ